MPGPACYGLGNEQPTVTDANVVLGLINSHALAGGRLAIDRRLSEQAILAYVAKPLGLTLEDAAHGIRAVANAAMSRAIRAVTVERGRDPRDLTLVAMGGNGGIHALDVARDLGISRVVVPPLAGVFSAVGMLASDLEHIALNTVTRALDTLTPAKLKRMKEELAYEVTRRLAADGFTGARVALAWEADLRHVGQATELTVHYDGDDLAEMSARFVAEICQDLRLQGREPDRAGEAARSRSGPVRAAAGLQTAGNRVRAPVLPRPARAPSTLRAARRPSIPRWCRAQPSLSRRAEARSSSRSSIPPPWCRQTLACTAIASATLFSTSSSARENRSHYVRCHQERARLDCR